MLHKCMENNSTEEVQENTPVTKLPFNNLFLNAGFVDGQNKFWMYVASISSIFFGYAFVAAIIGFFLRRRAFDLGITNTELFNDPGIVLDPNRMQIDKNWILVLEFSIFVMAFLSFVMAIRYIHLKHFNSLVTGFEKFRFNKFLFGFCTWACLVVITVLITYFTSSSNDLVMQFELGKFVKLFLICIVFLPIQTLCEEVVFRGYLLQGFSQVFKNGIIPLLLTSIMFGLAHMSNPETEAYGVAIMLSYYTMFGLFLGAITLLSEGLELAFGIHLANNLVSVLTITTQNSVLKTDAIFYSKSDYAVSELVIAFCSIIVVFVVFWFKFKWKNFSLLIK